MAHVVMLLMASVVMLLMASVVMLQMAPVVMPRIPRHILNGMSVKYFHETRTKRFGMPLDEFEKSKKNLARRRGRV
jgi:hypothetical protein